MLRIASNSRRDTKGCLLFGVNQDKPDENCKLRSRISILFLIRSKNRGKRVRLIPNLEHIISCINARRARATAFPYIAGREGGLSEPRARLVNKISPNISHINILFWQGQAR